MSHVSSLNTIMLLTRNPLPNNTKDNQPNETSNKTKTKQQAKAKQATKQQFNRQKQTKQTPHAHTHTHLGKALGVQPVGYGTGTQGARFRQRTTMTAVPLESDRWCLVKTSLKMEFVTPLRDRPKHTTRTPFGKGCRCVWWLCVCARTCV